MGNTTKTHTTTSERIAANVRAELDSQGITRDRFTRALGLGRSTTYRRLDGERWTVEDVDAAAAVLGVTPAHLFRAAS